MAKNNVSVEDRPLSLQAALEGAGPNGETGPAIVAIAIRPPRWSFKINNCGNICKHNKPSIFRRVDNNHPWWNKYDRKTQIGTKAR